MRIFGLEITRVPKSEGPSKVWNRSAYFESGRRVEDMTPDEMRRELETILAALDESPFKSAIIFINPADRFKRLRIQPRM